MEKTTELGTNKTGVDMSPILTKEMTHAGNLAPPNNVGSLEEFMELKQYFLETAEPLGSVPLPGTVKGAVKSVMKMATGKHPETFLNKLGERLAYERSGVRIYDAMIAKCRFSGLSGDSGFQVPLEQLEMIRNQEYDHFQMLVECMETLGADPTAQTPDADASAVASSGLMKVIQDPRTSISQSLEALLSVELTDNAAWELLATMANDMSLPDMAEKFMEGLRQEERHVELVKGWYEASVRGQTKWAGKTH